MKIAVNLTYLVDGKQPDGIGQYALNLFKGLQAIGKLDKNFHLFVFDDFYEKASSMFPEATVVPIAVFGDFFNLNKFHRFFKSLSVDQCRVPHFLKKDRYDLLFHPFNAVNDYLSRNPPTLVTIHDLFFKHFPGDLSKKYFIYVKYRYEKLIHKTGHLVVPSQFVKQDILKFYPEVDPEKITVINNPIWVNFKKTMEFPVNKPYILSVNSLRNHKNIITLLKAFQLIQDQVEHCLVLTGAKGDNRIDPDQYVAENRIKKVILTGYVTDEQRNYLYRQADLFVSPSLHEGFGMTPVEAALFEIPVLTTRETSIPEVTRDLLNYYEPAADPHELAAQILKLLKNRPTQSELQRAKQTLAQEYEPKKIAALYYDLFEHLTGR